ncbi:hypothetical protein MSG28_014506 [Choristoneura fumiferana]|uniref:Uncharacterized protein n=1 Tax=Choristoneura fumiferana TaxID=7141 RepID=A0ACC0JRX0_CHOFU|nr:hypothetical protein MSG28_014506 [Choristoneura fumiferana]
MGRPHSTENRWLLEPKSSRMESTDNRVKAAGLRWMQAAYNRSNWRYNGEAYVQQRTSYDPEQANEIYRTCSLYSNTRRLLTFDKPRALDCLDGIRSLSTLMIVVYHNFVVHFEVLKYVVNDLERIEWKYKAQGLWINSADLAVDSFFAMSGLLLVYTSFSKMTQSSLLRSLPWFYLNRFLRLFPLLAAAVLLQASLLRVADGPDNRFMVELVGYCRRYWWSALLFVQNFVNVLEISFPATLTVSSVHRIGCLPTFLRPALKHPSNPPVVPPTAYMDCPFPLSASCVPPSWYLSADMQLHVVSPLVLFWVLGSRRAAWAALAAALLASLAAAFAFCAIYPSPFSVEARGQIGNFKLYAPGPKIDINKGVKQGDPLSPKLFTACLQEIF